MNANDACKRCTTWTQNWKLVGVQTQTATTLCLMTSEHITTHRNALFAFHMLRAAAVEESMAFQLFFRHTHRETRRLYDPCIMYPRLSRLLCISASMSAREPRRTTILREPRVSTNKQPLYE